MLQVIYNFLVLQAPWLPGSFPIIKKAAFQKKKIIRKAHVVNYATLKTVNLTPESHQIKWKPSDFI